MSRRKSFRVAHGVLGLVSGFAALVKGAPASAQTTDDVRMIRPNVMILLDTSGSMEWRTGVSNNTCLGSDGGTCNRCSNSTMAAPVGICSPSCPGTEQKNRWVTALEVLTGSIQNYTCRELTRSDNSVFDYDHLYTIPYHEPLSGGQPLHIALNAQLPDGVLDVYADRVRFGLMTFDNDYCIGDTAGYGMYSYGRSPTFRAPGCNETVQINVGARRESRGTFDVVNGGLVSVGNPTADSEQLQLLNVNLQQVITGNPAYGPVPARRGVRPYGGTPIAGMLDDAREYWNNHPDVIDGSSGSAGDPYYRCRGRFNILVTDGKPNMDFRNVCNSPDTCPYDLPDQIVSSMATSRQVSTFVIAFNATDTGAALALGDIAREGDRSNMVGGVPLFASDRNELQANLSRILDGIAAGTSTRTQPSVGMTAAGTAGATLFQFNSAFTVAGGFPWRGVLERRRTSCSGTSPVAQPYNPAQRDDFGALMTTTGRAAPPGAAPAEWNDGAWGARKLWTFRARDAAAMQGMINSRGTSNSDEPANPGLASPSFAQVQDVDTLPAGHWNIPALSSVTPAKIRAWLRGTVPLTEPASAQLRNTYPLGDIYHSNPLLVTPPATSLPDQSYAAFRQTVLATGSGWRRAKTSGNAVTVGTRESVVYVGSNDGILHAFNVHTGEEIWGFVPPYLVPRSHMQYPANHQMGVDGTPVVRDVIFEREGTAANLGTGSSWRSLLVVGLRTGGPVYNALDVTDPYAPKFLWQFNGTRAEQPNDTATERALQPYVRDSYGTPAIATAYVRWAPGGGMAPSTPIERAVVIIPGGQGRPIEPCTSTSNRVPVRQPTSLVNSSTLGALRPAIRCWEGSLGQWLFVVDAKSGELIRRLGFNGSRTVPTGSPIVGSPSMYIGTEGAVATRGYVGDADGRIWRLDISNPDPNLWNFVPAIDLFSGRAYNVGQPIQSPITVSVDQSGDTILAVGTGNTDLLEGNEANRIAVYREHTTLSSGVVDSVEFSNVWELRPTDPPSTTIDRQKYLFPGERLTGPFSLFNGVLYFGTFVPATGTDRCEFGFSRLWGVDLTATDATDTWLPMPRFDADGDETTDDLVRVTSNLDGMGPVDDIDRNSVLFGVGVVREPVCVTVNNTTDPFLGGSRAAITDAGGGSFSLVAQTGRSTVMPGVSRTTVIRRRLPAPVVDIRLDAWASVFE